MKMKEMSLSWKKRYLKVALEEVNNYIDSLEHCTKGIKFTDKHIEANQRAYKYFVNDVRLKLGMLPLRTEDLEEELI
jgi:hypothetical protein